MNTLYARVARRAGHRCEYCRAPEAIFNSNFEVEHVYPTSRGGSDELDNLALACRACNGHKGAAATAVDPDTGNEVPRADRWDDHFAYDADFGVIRGLTASGRATVARLDMNHAQQISARQLWEQYRLFP